MMNGSNLRFGLNQGRGLKLGRGWKRARWVGVMMMAAAWAVPGFGGESYYPKKLEDARAVYVVKGAGGEQGTVAAVGDGVADDAAAIQAAVDRVATTTRAGVVFVPEGRYRLGKTVYVWQGVRLVGYGEKRPVFVLGKDTPGFQEEGGAVAATGARGKYMVHFADNRPNGNGPVIDASEFTFYSGMSNIDFEIGDGNPAAVAVRFHVAQHSYLTHIDFHVGSGLAAMEDIGNQASDLHVYGGKYGIITRRTAPVWQFLLMDSTFEGQSVAGIRTEEVGFTMVRNKFSHMPVAVEVSDVEQLYGRDLVLEDVKTAVDLGDGKNFRSETTLVNAACTDVPQFVKGAAGGETIASPGKNYVMEKFSHGLEIGEDGREKGIVLRHTEKAVPQAPAMVASDIPALPPRDTWVNVHTLDVKGDGTTDDTAALQAAIEKHQALYFPMGTYRVSAPLVLKADTVLVGLHPSATTIALANGAAGFQGAGDLAGVVETPRGGKSIVSTMSVNPGGGNARAVAVLWRGGSQSMLEDVSFTGGRGGGGGGRGARGAGGAPAGGRGAPAGGGGAPARGAGGGGGGGANAAAAPDLLVTDGGGGIFRGNWPHGTSSNGGLRVENTSTPSRIYQLSNEHHLRAEVEFHNVKNWEIYALQTEEENPAGADAIALEIVDSENLLFANTYMYRVSRNVLPKPYAVTVKNSGNVAFENVKVFSQTRLSFDNAVLDESNGAAVRSHFLTRYVVEKGAKPPAALPVPGVFAGALEKLSDGFSNASGLSVDGAGNLFFSDAAMHRIYRWDAQAKKAEVMAQLQGQPMTTAFVAPSTLLAITYEKGVFSLDTSGTGAAEAKQVQEVEQMLPGTKLLLPTGMLSQWWVLENMMEKRGFVFKQGSNTAIVSVVPQEHRGYFYAPGTTTAIMAGGTWRPLHQTSSMAVFAPGDSHYIASEDDARTYLATLGTDGKLTAKVFAERGGHSAVTDEAGNVYIADGQVYIYDRSGKQIGVLETPERPASLAFGGADRKTLYIGARSSLYAIRVK